jgi:hypothetical protein
MLMLYDAVCTTCGYELDFPETAIDSKWNMAHRPQRGPAA